MSLGMHPAPLMHSNLKGCIEVRPCVPGYTIFFLCKVIQGSTSSVKSNRQENIAFRRSHKCCANTGETACAQSRHILAKPAA